MTESRPPCPICEPDHRGYDMLRAGEVSDPSEGPEIDGVHLAAEVGFRAPDGHLKLWIAKARDESADGPCCAPERIELTLMQMLESYMAEQVGSPDGDAELLEIAAYLRHLAGWIERGCHART